MESNGNEEDEDGDVAVVDNDAKVSRNARSRISVYHSMKNRRAEMILTVY